MDVQRDSRLKNGLKQLCDLSGRLQQAFDEMSNSGCDTSYKYLHSDGAKLWLLGSGSIIWSQHILTYGDSKSPGIAEK